MKTIIEYFDHEEVCEDVVPIIDMDSGVIYLRDAEDELSDDIPVTLIKRVVFEL